MPAGIFMILAGFLYFMGHYAVIREELGVFFALGDSPLNNIEFKKGG